MTILIDLVFVILRRVDIIPTIHHVHLCSYFSLYDSTENPFTFLKLFNICVLIKREVVFTLDKDGRCFSCRKLSTIPRATCYIRI